MSTVPYMRCRFAYTSRFILLGLYFPLLLSVLCVRMLKEVALCT